MLTLPRNPDGSAAAPVYRPGNRIDLTAGASPSAYVFSGWYCAGPDLRWSTQRAGITFRLGHVQSLWLLMMASSFGTQPCTVELNGAVAGT